MNKNNRKYWAIGLGILFLVTAFSGVFIKEYYSALSILSHLISLVILPFVSYIGFVNYPKYKHYRAILTTVGYALFLVLFHIDLGAPWNSIVSSVMGIVALIISFYTVFKIYL